MKKIIILAMAVFTVISACKKEKKEQTKVFDDALISTTWLTVSEKHEYYDGSNVKIFEETMSPGVKYVFIDSTRKVNVTFLDGLRIIKDYSISHTNGKNLLTITSNTATDTYEVTAYTNKTMSWTEEKLDQTYQDGDGEKVAAKKVISMDFHCPCRE
jgi:hypothetical protein